MDANDYYLNQYLNEQVGGDEANDYLHDNYEEQVYDFISEYSKKVDDTSISDYDFDLWYVNNFEPVAMEVFNEMESYLTERNYDYKLFPIMIDFGEILC